MAHDDPLRAGSDSLRARVSALIEAILRISGDLDVDVVLQQIADEARSLTDARYSAITTMDDSGDLQDLLVSGMTDEEQQELLSFPDGSGLFKYLSGLREPLRISDLPGRRAGL